MIFLQLGDEPLVWLDNTPSFSNYPQGFLVPDAPLLHQVTGQDGGRAGYPCNAEWITVLPVDQNILVIAQCILDEVIGLVEVESYVSIREICV